MTLVSTRTKLSAGVKTTYIRTVVRDTQKTEETISCRDELKLI